MPLGRASSLRRGRPNLPPYTRRWPFARGCAWNARLSPRRSDPACPCLGRVGPRRGVTDGSSLEELLLLVGGDGAVRGRVGDARQAEARAHLVVVEERAVRLVNGASGDLARAGGAGARAARVGQVEAILLS